MYIDGCFWHACPDHLHMPKANAAWWVAKIDMIKARDASINA
ncbi:very short patch repair endonuclease [Blastococcus saxobsidens]